MKKTREQSLLRLFVSSFTLKEGTGGFLLLPPLLCFSPTPFYQESRIAETAFII